ncbi:MAG: NAD(P)-binding domain-containing protein, partial [bacterium]|nr:NAD(P)-binding domain-containing protein [bacterium]
MLKKYFNWLQKDTPTGEVEKFPEIDASGQTSVKGIYVVGDLTGIPLLKLAADSGAAIINRFNEDSGFRELRKAKGGDVLDFVIVGAGPAGIAAGLEAKKHGYDFKIVETANAFSTIINFPKGKPIYAEPESYRQVSQLEIREGKKESLLEELDAQISGKDLPIDNNTNVENIVKHKDHFEIATKEKTYKTLRVILATGKSGNSRQLKVPGENLEKVFNRLIDPMDAAGLDVLVVGGGDSALETAVAVAEYAKSVTLSYRKETFSRPKEGNLEKLNQLADQGKIELLLETTVKEITPDKAVLIAKNKNEITIVNSMVFVLIGKQLPLDFFKKINVKIEGVFGRIEKLMFFALLMFSGVVYFGKSSMQAMLSAGGEQVTVTWGYMFSRLLSFEFWGTFLAYPFKGGFWEKTGQWWEWPKAFYGIMAYLCFITFLISGIIVLVHFFKSIKTYTATAWKTFKYTYFIIVALFFTTVYFGTTYFGLNVLGKSPGFWYTFLYSLTIVVFGLRRMHVNPTRYIKLQTWTLMLVQVIPLFLLPEIILPLLGKAGLLGGSDGFILTQVFPNGEYWRTYGLVLAWPLNIYGMFADKITTFWLIYTILFTFGFIYYIVYRWGKGAYCGWICSCGAMAETLGDEYRTLAPHGAKAKKWENVGQWVLGFAFIITLLKMAAVLGGMNIPVIHSPRPFLLDYSGMIYSFVVDVIFAGVLGVGVYFFMSGRVWCRFFCPLAALMHI